MSPTLGRDDLVDALVVPLVELDDALGLVADVDDDVVADDVEDPALDDLVGVEDGLVGADPLGDFGVEHVVEVEIGLEVVDVDRMDEVAVGH